MERKGLGNEKTVDKGGIGNVGAACGPRVTEPFFQRRFSAATWHTRLRTYRTCQAVGLALLTWPHLIAPLI